MDDHRFLKLLPLSSPPPLPPLSAQAVEPHGDPLGRLHPDGVGADCRGYLVSGSREAEQLNLPPNQSEPHRCRGELDCLGYHDCPDAVYHLVPYNFPVTVRQRQRVRKQPIGVALAIPLDSSVKKY